MGMQIYDVKPAQNRKYAMINKKIQHIKVCKCALLRKCYIVILKKKKL